MLGTALKHWSQGTKPQYKWSENRSTGFKGNKISNWTYSNVSLHTRHRSIFVTICPWNIRHALTINVRINPKIQIKLRASPKTSTFRNALELKEHCINKIHTEWACVLRGVNRTKYFGRSLLKAHGYFVISWVSGLWPIHLIRTWICLILRVWV